MEGNKHILIVDDDAEFAGMVAEAVRDVSDTYTVQVSMDANAAIAEVQGAQATVRSYDLVITDIKMPGSSGLQLLETLAQIAPETKTITMTAYHSPELAAQAEQLNVHAYLIKPIALSEFRQVVRNALSSPTAGIRPPSPSSQLSAAQRTNIERRLANLRTITNSTSTLLVHIDSTVLATDALRTDIDADALCEALNNAQQIVAQAIGHALSTDAPIQQSYYGTETCGICMYRLDNSHFIVAVFDATVREGHVWYCMREAGKELVDLLSGGVQDKPDSSTDVGESWRHKIEQYFASTPTKRTRTRQPTQAADANPTNIEAPTMPPAVQPVAAPHTDTDPDRVLADSESLRPSPDQINWDILPEGNWDEIVAEVGGTFEGIGLEQAQEQGLYTPQPSDVNATQDPERPSVEDIDWNISPDLDWDRLVANTDQGFAGMDFEEAKKRGIIDDLEAD